MEITGILHKIDEVENYGSSFQTRFFYVRIIDKYAKIQYLKFRLSNNRIELLDGFNLNDEIVINFELEGNEVKNAKNEFVIFDRKEVYGITSSKDSALSKLNVSTIYLPTEGEEDEELSF